VGGLEGAMESMENQGIEMRGRGLLFGLFGNAVELQEITSGYLRDILRTMRVRYNICELHVLPLAHEVRYFRFGFRRYNNATL
jgi:hypothetical protein